MFSIIVAMSENKVIGKDNKIPWHYSEDLKYFKKITENKIVVMGSKTYDSIIGYLNKPLPNRRNIVITSKMDKYENVETYQSIDAFIDKYKDHEGEIFIIGGRSIYEQFMTYIEKMYITYIDKDFDGDTYFPDYDENEFTLISEEKNNELRFCVYIKQELGN